MNMQTGDAASGCPVHKGAARALLGRTNKDWWPEALPVDILHQNGVSPDPTDPGFDYAEAFKALDYAALAARARIPAGESERFCVECGEPIPERRRIALPGVQTCVPCQSGRDRQVAPSAINRRGSKDSQLR